MACVFSEFTSIKTYLSMSRKYEYRLGQREEDEDEVHDNHVQARYFDFITVLLNATLINLSRSLLLHKLS